MAITICRPNTLHLCNHLVITTAMMYRILNLVSILALFLAVLTGCSGDQRIEPQGQLDEFIAKHHLKRGGKITSEGLMTFKSIEEADAFLGKFHATLTMSARKAHIDLQSGFLSPKNGHNKSSNARSANDDWPEGSSGDGYSQCYWGDSDFIDNLTGFCYLKADFLVTYDCGLLMGSGGGGGNSPSRPQGSSRLEVHGIDFKVRKSGVCLGIGLRPIFERSSFSYTSNSSISVNWYYKGEYYLDLFIEGVGELIDSGVIEGSGTKPIFISI